MRDKMLFGELDAAQAPGGFLLAINAGATPNIGRCLTGFVMSAQGNAITLSTALYQKGIRDVADLAALARSRPGEPLTFGVVSRHSSHAHLLTSWLRAGGVDVKEDVRIVVLPPQQMVTCLQSQHIDGFCAGEPWNTVAVNEESGWVASDSAALAPMHPEKVLLVHENFAMGQHEEHMALLRAQLLACEWCADPENREELGDLLSQVVFPGLPAKLIQECLESKLAPIFSGPELHAPSESKARWLLDEMRKESLLPEVIKDEELLSAFRVDLFESMNESWEQFDYDD